MLHSYPIWRALLIAGACAAAHAAEIPEFKEIKRTVPINLDGRVLLDTYKGKVNITTWDQPSLDIYARIEPDNDGAPSDREQVQATEVVIDSSPSSVRIKSDYHKLKDWHWGPNIGGNRPFVNYTIKMPRTARLEIRDYKSTMHIGDLRSDFNLQTYKGTAEVSSLQGSLRVNTYKGDVRISSARLTGNSRVETYKGEIDLGLARDAGVTLDSDLGRRATLRSDFGTTIRGSQFRRQRMNLSGDVNGGGPALHLRSHKGRFVLRAS